MGGLLQKGPKLPKEVKNLMRWNMTLAQQMRDEAMSAPLANPMERMALAQARGLLGGEQAMQQQGMYAAFNPATDSGNMGDMMRNMLMDQGAQRTALDQQHLFEALANRHNLMMQAAQVAGGAGPLATAQKEPGGPDFSSLFGNLANMMAYRQARTPQTQQGTGFTGTSTLNPLTTLNMNAMGNTGLGGYQPTNTLGTFQGGMTKQNLFRNSLKLG